jgi:hypothetical protein
MVAKNEPPLPFLILCRLLALLAVVAILDRSLLYAVTLYLNSPGSISPPRDTSDQVIGVHELEILKVRISESFLLHEKVSKMTAPGGSKYRSF